MAARYAQDLSGKVPPHRVRASALQLQQRDLRLGPPRSGGLRLISLPTPAEKYLDYWLLQRDQWKVILPCDHPLAGRQPFPPEALEQYPLILLDEGDDYEIQAIFDHYKVRPRIQYTVQQDQTILAMVSGGLGISVMEELMLYKCAYPLAASTLPKVFHRDIGICVKDKNALSHSTRAFIDHARHWVLQNFPEGWNAPKPHER